MVEIRPSRSRILLISFLTAGRSLLLRLYLTSSLKTLRLDVAGILIVVGFVPPPTFMHVARVASGGTPWW